MKDSSYFVSCRLVQKHVKTHNFSFYTWIKDNMCFQVLCNMIWKVSEFFSGFPGWRGAFTSRQDVWRWSRSVLCTVSGVCVWTGSGCRTLSSSTPASKVQCATKIWVFPRRWRFGWTLERCPAGRPERFEAGLSDSLAGCVTVIFAGTGNTALRFPSRWWMAVVVAMGNFPAASTMLWSGQAWRSNRAALQMRMRRAAAQTAAWAPAACLSAPFPASKATLSPKQSQLLATPTVSTG